MDVVVDRLTRVDYFGPFGEGNAEYVAQTFTAEAWQLHQAEFLIDTRDTTPGASVFRVLITTVEVDAGGQHPGIVLFESDKIVNLVDTAESFEKISVETGNLKLVPGQSYAMVVDFLVESDGVANAGYIGTSLGFAGGTDYPGGGLIFFNAAGGDRTSHFASDWLGGSGDMSFRLVFSTEGETIVGTRKNDVVDATHAPKNQPLASIDDDRILGSKGNDKLSGLAGYDEIRGEVGNDKLFGGDDGDILIGGKGKDKLAGGPGRDFFVFDASLKEKPDSVIDFNPIDDTIWLSQKVFKSLPQGVFSDAVFRDVGEAATGSDLIAYKSNGKLYYDSDGPGGSKAIHFATLASKPDITAADFDMIA